jgi:polyhydroxybutyrate depolymerase
MNRAPVALVGFAVACLVLVGCANNGNEQGAGDEVQREMTDTGDSGDLVERDGIDSESELVVLQEVEGEEINRRALVVLPDDYDPATSYSIVLGFHGNGQTPEDFAWMAERVCSFEPECIAVVPEGFKRSWNLGVEESTADDVAFVSDLVAELSSRFPLTSDFFALGHSNGSGLVHVLATETSLFRGIAGFGSVLIEGREPSPGTAATSVLQVHGMNDDVIPYSGGDSPVGLRFVPAEDSAELWAKVSSCSAGTNSADELGNRILSFEECVDGHRVLHYGLVDQGHDAGMSEEFALIASEFFNSVR